MAPASRRLCWRAASGVGTRSHVPCRSTPSVGCMPPPPAGAVHRRPYSGPSFSMNFSGSLRSISSSSSVLLQRRSQRPALAALPAKSAAAVLGGWLRGAQASLVGCLKQVQAVSCRCQCNGSPSLLYISYKPRNVRSSFSTCRSAAASFCS